MQIPSPPHLPHLPHLPSRAHGGNSSKGHVVEAESQNAVEDLKSSPWSC